MKKDYNPFSNLLYSQLTTLGDNQKIPSSIQSLNDDHIPTGTYLSHPPHSYVSFLLSDIEMEGFCLSLSLFI